MPFILLRSLCPAGGEIGGRRATWILLNPCSRVGVQMNSGTTATAKSRDGHRLEVSLWSHEPPALSYICARCHVAPGSDPGPGLGFNLPP